MRIAIAGFATTVFAFITVATAPFAAASPDQDFLDALADGGVTYPANATRQVLTHGHMVCQDFATGATFTDAVGGVAGGMGGNQRLAGQFVRAATNTLCPKFLDELP
jgi:Protein of unknown function (DUF732)